MLRGATIQRRLESLEAEVRTLRDRVCDLERAAFMSVDKVLPATRFHIQCAWPEPPYPKAPVRDVVRMIMDRFELLLEEVPQPSEKVRLVARS